MKSLFVALCAALLGVSALFADDIADVKAVIFKHHELQERRAFEALPALYSRDYMQINTRGESCDYVMLKLFLISLDGRHPEEFLQFMAMQANGGRLPSPETMAWISQMASDPQVVREYKAALALAFAYAEMMRDVARLVVEEYDGYDPESGAAKHKIVTLVLRRENGVWRYFREIDEQ